MSYADEAAPAECAGDASSGWLRIYVNGVEQACAAVSEPGAAGDFLLGGNPTDDDLVGGFLRGRLDEFALFDRPLDASEVAALSAGASSSEAMRDVVLGVGGCAAAQHSHER